MSPGVGASGALHEGLVHAKWSMASPVCVSCIASPPPTKEKHNSLVADVIKGKPIFEKPLDTIMKIKSLNIMEDQNGNNPRIGGREKMSEC